MSEIPEPPDSLLDIPDNRFERDRLRTAWRMGYAEAVGRVRQFCESRMVEAQDGGLTDADTVWPSEIIALLTEQHKEAS